MEKNTDQKINKVAVIGGGASGMAAALFAANNNCQITLFERNDCLGKKILSTGNGRCNLSNTSLNKEAESIDFDYFYRGECIPLLINAFKCFDYSKLMSFFESIGIDLINKDGYIYPRSNQASSVKMAFEKAIMNNKNIDLRLNTKINNISKEKDSFTVCYKKTEKEDFDKVILCSGGCAFPKSGSDGTSFYLLDKLGIKYNKMLPSLCECKTTDLTQSAGVRAAAMVCLFCDGKQIGEYYSGEIQINKNGISGIVVFQLSGIIARLLDENKKPEIVIDFVQDISIDMLINRLNERKVIYDNENIDMLLNSIIPYGLINTIVKRANLSIDTKNSLLRDGEIINIAKILKAYTVKISSVSDFDMAQTGTGGVVLNEINDKFELNRYKGMYVCGEIVDIDGICGGYNLTFAFISGAIAGMDASI